MITDYKVVYGCDKEDLSDEVKECMGEGYEPFEGGFGVTTTTYKNRDGEDCSANDFYQVMVKRLTYQSISESGEE